jgi:CAAX prenyl protease-like protein
VARYGAGSAIAWLFIAVRILGSSLVVPPLEEVFYRSFLYRRFIDEDFLKVPSGRFAVGASVACSALFGLMHTQWLPGILGVWVVWKDAWHFG